MFLPFKSFIKRRFNPKMCTLGTCVWLIIHEDRGATAVGGLYGLSLRIWGLYINSSTWKRQVSEHTWKQRRSEYGKVTPQREQKGTSWNCKNVTSRYPRWIAGDLIWGIYAIIADLATTPEMVEPLRVWKHKQSFTAQKMGAVLWWLCLSCIFGALAVPCRGINSCLDGITFNVILLDDAESPWGLQYVKGEVLKAIETDKGISDKEGNNGKKTRQHMDLDCFLLNTNVPH